MSVIATLTRLNELALILPRPECGWEDRPRFKPPVTSKAVDELECLAGFALPSDLREFLGQTESIVAMSFHNGYWIGDIDQLMKVDSWPHVANGEIAIPIATDGGGNVFLLVASGQVWQWNHETNKLRLVAASFCAFLERVAEDWVAYLSSELDWQFLV